MDDTVGRAWFELAGRDDQLDKDLRGAEQKIAKSGATGAASFEKSYTGASQKVSAGFGKVSTALAGIGLAIGLSTAISFFDGAISAASDLNETISKTGVILGKESLPELETWAEGMATAFGQSKKEALDAASTFAIFGKSAGLAGQDLATFSIDLAELGGDLSSFFGGKPEEAIQAIGAALRGESEPIRRYGVLLDEATLRQRAMKLGIIETTTQALTPQQRVLAAQAEILAQTSDAQGDYARTSGDLAQQQKSLTAQLDNVTASIGTELLPIMVELATWANDTLVPALEALVQLAKDAAPAFEFLGDVFQGVFMPAQGAVDHLTALSEAERRSGEDTRGWITDMHAQIPDAQAAAEGLAGPLPAELAESGAEAVTTVQDTLRELANAMIGGQEEWQKAVEGYSAFLETNLLPAAEAAALVQQIENFTAELVKAQASGDREWIAEVEATLATLKARLYSSGQLISYAFSAGFASPSALDRARWAAGALAGAFSGPLRAESPPKEGPLREIGRWAHALGKYYGEGSIAAVRDAWRNAHLSAGDMVAMMGGASAMPGGLGGGGGLSGTATLRVIIEDPGRALATVPGGAPAVAGILEQGFNVTGVMAHLRHEAGIR